MSQPCCPVVASKTELTSVEVMSLQKANRYVKVGNKVTEDM